MAVSGAWPGMVAFLQFRLVVLCWGSQRRYPVWTIHYNVTILITFETPNVGAISCYMSLFLVLETVILIIWHHVDHRWWSNHGSQLFQLQILCHWVFCGPFTYMSVARLWAFFKPLMNILMVAASFVKLPLSFCPELVDVHCEELLFLLLDLPWSTRFECGYCHYNTSVITDPLISFQDLFKVMASVTNVCINPLDFALASLALFLLVRSQCQWNNLLAW